MSAQESIPGISKKLDGGTKIALSAFFLLHFIALPFLLMLAFNLPADLFPGCPSGRLGSFFVYSLSGYITSSIFLLYFMIYVWVIRVDNLLILLSLYLIPSAISYLCTSLTFQGIGVQHTLVYALYFLAVYLLLRWWFGNREGRVDERGEMHRATSKIHS